MILTPEQLQEIGPEALQKVRAELARRSLKEFVHQAWPVIEPGTPLVWGWVLDAMTEHLEAVTRGEIKRLVINVPPGTMKSKLTSVLWPAWTWLNKPHYKFLSSSYALSLAERNNVECRRILQSEWYGQNFGIYISSEEAGKVNFSTDKLGVMRAISVGGATTGYRGDSFIIDDPHDVSKAESDAKRAEAVQWFVESAQTRLNSLRDSSIVVVMQRVHEEDVTATAVEMGYELLRVPMRWDESQRNTTSIGWTDPRAKEGELMWPERFPEKELGILEQNMGAYATAAQMQQTPVPRKGGLLNVDAIKIIDELPDEALIGVRAWDMAASEGAGAYTVGLNMVYAPQMDKFIITDVRRKQIGPGDVRKLILNTADDDGIATKIVLPQDPGQAGKAVVQNLIADLTGYNVKAEIQSGAKETRAQPLATQMDIGRVCVLNRTWTKALLDEMRFFPRGKYKDQVDATASAFNELAAMTRRGRKTPQLSLVGAKQDNVFKVA
jgi:predicted phage terminase large subunit-like protein